MIDYDLAKKLKEHGFPEGFMGDREATIGNGDGYPRIFCPDLSELIEACGDGFKGLLPPDSALGYMAFSKIGKIRLDAYGTTILSECEIWIGKTPEEAVAKLWLELNPMK